MRQRNTRTVSQWAVTLLATCIALMTFSGHARPVSDVVTGKGDVVIGPAMTASIVIAARSGLKAGRTGGMTVADVTATATRGTVAVRWQPGVGVINPGKANNAGNLPANDWAKITGKYTRQPLVFVLRLLSGASVQSRTSPEWFYAKDGSGRMTFKMELGGGVQTPPVDIYPVSLDAAVWSE